MITPITATEAAGVPQLNLRAAAPGVQEAPAGASSDSLDNEPGSFDINEYLRTSSPMMDALGLAPAADEVPEETADEEAQEAQDEVPEAAEAEESEEAEPAEEATAEVDPDSVDWDFEIPVTVKGADGKDIVQKIPLAQLRDLAATKADLDAREAALTTATQATEQARQESLADLITLGRTLHDDLMVTENALAVKYTDTKTAMEKAKAEGDNFTARELRDVLTDTQEQYWAARKGRESKLAAVVEKVQQQEAVNKQALIDNFAKEAKTVLPGFNADTAKAIREFAIQEGIAPELLDNIYDAKAVKFINDYRLLKQTLAKGKIVREKAPIVKRQPIRTGVTTTPDKATQAQRQQLRTKVFSGEAGAAEQNDFLKSIIKTKF
jgi:hypothetical protein